MFSAAQNAHSRSKSIPTKLVSRFVARAATRLCKSQSLWEIPQKLKPHLHRQKSPRRLLALLANRRLEFWRRCMAPPWRALIAAKR